jgi:hypothetical protein
MSDEKAREEQIKNKLARNYFADFDCTNILGNVDFCVTSNQKDSHQTSFFSFESFFWAEAKKGKANFITSIVQLILTIGKARTFDTYLPPAYLGSFDTERIAFVPYNEIHDVFYVNDFNWNVTPSNYDTKEFKQLHERVIENIEKHSFVFYFGKDDEDINEFIETNFIVGKSSTSKVRIDKNNFIVIYNKWLSSVKPTITVDWNFAKKIGIIDGDFYLADLLSNENETLKEKLYVLLKKDYYEFDRKLSDFGSLISHSSTFKDKQKAHHEFWNKYERPPKTEYWDYIVERRDLLVPQDVRERKGSFFTPQIWVELSQKYLTDTLGQDWQDEYYIWDCAAGTGNLLAGLTNKYNIFASTLDKQDVDVMHSRIDTMNANSASGQGSNLLQDHVFQFDFLNDSFDKLPKQLLSIINNPEKRKKLVIYINPPYAEASSYGKNSIAQVANETKIFNSFKSIVGSEAMSELFAQFFIRVNKEIPDSFLASFSTPKYITSEKFDKFRNHFNAEYQKGFVCKSDTFDNVKGKFPICFLIWKFKNNVKTEYIETDVFSNNKEVTNYLKKGKKNFYPIKNNSIADWRKTFYFFGGKPISHTIIVGPSMQSNNNTFITNYPAESYKEKGMVADITIDNLIEMTIYLSVRHSIAITWLNNKDQFLYPNDKWEKDKEFQNDCLTFSLFHGQNKVSAEQGTNNWIPFKEQEVNARARFDSNFMTDFISGKIKKQNGNHLFDENQKPIKTPLQFSEEAKSVFDAGRELWKYYHIQPTINVDASLYDIRAYFQGRNTNGKMNLKSDDETYTQLIANLRNSLKILAKKIEPKIYEYGFLKE